MESNNAIAKELRLGNIISHVDEPYYIAAINYEDATVTGVDREAYNGTFDYTLLSRMPLDDEWLNRFGFIKDPDFEDNFFTNHKGISIEKNGNEYYYCIQRYSYTVKIDYVHELQNLYYALEKEELEIK